MAKTEFKSESKRLLDLMINSIYTHKEIFLREIISNASDAIDKLYYISLTDTNVGLDKNDFKIRIDLDKENRTITITDNGIGMDADDLDANLGTIANSGSLKFKQENDKTDDVDIIGQFGVGFYSAFMVADEITVRSKKYGCDKAYQWVSSGADGYEITETDKDDIGTQIILKIKEDNENEKYSEFLEKYKKTLPMRNTTSSTSRSSLTLNRLREYLPTLLKVLWLRSNRFSLFRQRFLSTTTQKSIRRDYSFTAVAY